jgi:hypothetical protein
VAHASFRPIQVSALVLAIYALYERYGITGILVEEVGALLARYERRFIKGFGSTLFDLISEKPCIPVEDHLQALRKRLMAKMHP